METNQFLQTFLLAQLLGLCAYKLSERLGRGAIVLGVLTPPATFLLVQCARWIRDESVSTQPNNEEELLGFLFGLFLLLFGVLANLSGAVITIFLAHKFAPYTPPTSSEK